MIIREAFLGLVGLSAGVIIAGAYVVLIASLGIFTRLQAWSRWGRHNTWMEHLILFGIVFGNIVTLYSVDIPGGGWCLGLLGISFGIFTGCLAAALADVVKLFPMLAHRLDIRWGLSFLVGGLALGKTVGSMLQFFWL